MAGVRSIFSSKGAGDGDGDAYTHTCADALLTGQVGLKVRAVALHACQPWVLCGDDLGIVSVFDYEQGILAFKMQPELHVAGLAKSTRVRLVAFLDAPDAAWRRRLELEAAVGVLHRGRGTKDLGGLLLAPLHASAAPDWNRTGACPTVRPVAVVTEAALLLIDCSTRRVRQVNALDPRVINALHVVPQLPAAHERSTLALACADGFVRILNESDGQIKKELSCGKKKVPALNHVVALASSQPSGGTGKSARDTAAVIVVAAGSDGALYAWNVAHSDLPVFTVAAGAEVTGLQVTAAGAERQLFTFHADKTLAVWAIEDSPNCKVAEMARAKPRSAVLCSHPFYTLNRLQTPRLYLQPEYRGGVCGEPAERC